MVAAAAATGNHMGMCLRVNQALENSYTMRSSCLSTRGECLYYAIKLFEHTW
jgi:hypothetical protein